MRTFLAVTALILAFGSFVLADTDDTRYGTFACHGGVGNIQYITVGESGYSIDGIVVIKGRWQGQNVNLNRLVNDTWVVSGHGLLANCW